MRCRRSGCRLSHHDGQCWCEPLVAKVAVNHRREDSPPTTLTTSSFGSGGCTVMLDTARSPNVLSPARVAGSGAVLGTPAARRIGADCQGDAMPAAQVLPAVDGSRSADDSGVPRQRRVVLIDP